MLASEGVFSNAPANLDIFSIDPTSCTIQTYQLYDGNDIESDPNISLHNPTNMDAAAI